MSGVTGAILVARREHDVSTMRRQLRGDLITNPTACTGDDRRTPVEAGNIAETPVAFHPITPSLRPHVSYLTYSMLIIFGRDAHRAAPRFMFGRMGRRVQPAGHLKGFESNP
jgi:hypothetical protein